ncbi:MAG: DUF3754 domain-containing protein [Mariniblastus sp.]|nr:DUF3754 domain-containing protein [Mariniblastus sp.]
MNLRNSPTLNSRIEDDPIVDGLPKRTTFIPLRQKDLQKVLINKFELGDSELGEYKKLCSRLQAIFHVEHLASLLYLEEIYDTLDPDSNIVDLETVSVEKREALTNALLNEVEKLLFSAHYKRLSREELERAIEVGCQWGVQLDVNFDMYERLEIFARGYRTVQLTRRRWQKLFRLESIELPEFQRLIMAFRMSPALNAGKKDKFKKNQKSLDEKFVYLKAFKNIPENDLEILLPGSKVRLTKLDRAKILLPTLSGMAFTIWKVARGVLVLSLAFHFANILGWAILIGAIGGYVFKSVLSYLNTKNKYQFGLTESLYIKNLDNNSGVIYRILNEAEEQELCEAVLAYTFLWKCAGTEQGLTEDELDKLVEEFLEQTTGIDVDFEVHDGLEKLERLALATKNDRQEWTASPIHLASELLNKNWSELFESRVAQTTGFDHPLDDGLFTN